MFVLLYVHTVTYMYFVQVSDFWLHYKVVLEPQKSILHKDTYILKNTKAIKLELNSSMESMSCIKTSPYIEPFKVNLIQQYVPGVYTLINLILVH